MTEQKAFKRLVRTRMAETGERYTTARARLVGAADAAASVAQQDDALGALGEVVLAQLASVTALGLPELAGTTEAAVRERADSLLRSVAPGFSTTASDRLPALLVLPGVDVERAMPLTRQGAKAGYVDMRPVGPDGFEPVVEVPDDPYLLLDVDAGRETLGLSPRDAATHIAAAGRSPLTLAEGVALLVLHPGLLRERTCFQMLGSRRDDKRIASLWVTKQGTPRLGWCYEGVPHTWLGSASCAARVA